MKITYYVEVISSWCWWAEPAWLEVQQRYAGRVAFDWKIALIDSTGLPASANQCDWFYRRSGTLVRSPYMLNSGWYQPGLTEYLAPNFMAEAARSLGVGDDRVRLALAEAAVRQGLKVGDWNVSAKVAAKASGLPEQALLELAKSPEIEARVRKTTAEFHALQVTQRPTFVVESPISDKAVFSGLATAGPLIAAVEWMLADAAGYASYKTHFGGPPSA